jgi:ribosomal protein L40E
MDIERLKMYRNKKLGDLVSLMSCANCGSLDTMLKCVLCREAQLNQAGNTYCRKCITDHLRVEHEDELSN